MSHASLSGVEYDFHHDTGYISDKKVFEVSVKLMLTVPIDTI